jgi:hypothetical protein
VPLASRCFLFTCRTCRRSAGTSVKAHAIYGGGGVYYGCRVNVANVRDVNIVDGLVVIELICSPISAIVAAAGITVSVLNAAIIADDWAPVAGMPIVQSVVKSPVSRRPELARFRGKDPGAGYPVISVTGTPSPVARLPEVAFGRAKGLLINRQRGRGRVDRYKDLGAEETPDTNRITRANNIERIERMVPPRLFAVRRSAACSNSSPDSSSETLFPIGVHKHRH